MKFIYSDSLDYVDPGFDFANDEHTPGRQPYWDDQFPHEILSYAPYDGLLVSRAIVGDHQFPGKYSESQAMRFRRVGARRFLRFDGEEFQHKPVFGDCGAFSYSKMKVPPYKPTDTVEFYYDGQFTHGCSIDHIIFEFDETVRGMKGGSDDAHERFEITQQLATEFINEASKLGKGFTPIGVVQGWSPDSMAVAARNLIAMGYQYIAIGGLVPLKSKEIHAAVAAVDEVLKAHPSVRLHLLGFAKADTLHEFTQYRITSFDTTSPLIRAFKDNTRNYYLAGNNGQMDYFTAIRIPSTHGNVKLKNHIRSGRFQQEELLEMEQAALQGIRSFSRHETHLDAALDAIINFSRPMLTTASNSEKIVETKLNGLREKYGKTLERRPWEQCQCPICRALGVEVIIFRSSNRNKRRGIHNLTTYKNHLSTINLQ